MSRRRFSIVRIFRVRESGNAEFWIANLVVMASTIIGVYLAAQAGFKTALQFEVARSERDGFYMRRALLDELKDKLEPDFREGASQSHFRFVFFAVRHLDDVLVQRRHSSGRSEDEDLRLGNHEAADHHLPARAAAHLGRPSLLREHGREYEGRSRP
jgi:hypothetical protein